MSGGFFDQSSPVSPEGAELPLWVPDAAAQMKIDVTVNAEGHVMVLHDRPFPDYLEWIEFDADRGEMTFVTAEGKMQNLGMIIHAPMNRYVARARNICTVCIREGVVRDLGIVPLLVHSGV
ncbi:MAG TPA: hypothetical protein VGD95_00290 [Micavibrio sp.]